MKLRPESSVSPDLNEHGELCFPGSADHGTVIHRTPEELGIPLALTPAEVLRIVGGLPAEKQVAFVEAGLRAALLT